MKNVSEAILDSIEGPSVRWSIGTKLIITFLSLAIIPMSVVAFYNLTQFRNEMTMHSKNELVNLSLSTAASIEQLIIENQRNSAMLAGDPLTRQFMAATDEDRQKLYPKIKKMLKNFADTHPDYFSPGLLDANGIVVATLIDKLEGKDRSFRDYFQVSIKGKPYVSNILVGKATGRPGVFLTNPVFSEDGNIIGIVLLWLKADTILEIIDQVKIGKDGIAYLVDHDSVIVAHPNRKLLYHSLGKLNSEAISTITSTIRFGINKDTKKPFIPETLGLDELASWIALKSETNSFYYVSPLSHKKHVVGYSTIKNQPWTVVVDLPEKQFMTSLDRMQTIAYISIGIVTLITILISILLVKTITRPIRLLTDISVDVMHSKPLNLAKIEKVIKGRDEIAHLGRVFQNMIVSLRESEEKYRNLIDSSPDLRYRADMEGKISFISQSVEQLSGYTIEESIGMKLKDQYVSPEERDRFLSKLQKNGFVNEFEAQLKRKDGTIWWASTNAHFSKDQVNNIIGIEGVTRDVTERKQMEKTLQQSLDFREQILSKSPVGISIYNAESGQCVATSNSMAEIIGATKKQVLAQNFYDIESWKTSDLLNTAKSALRENSLKKIEVSVESTFGEKVSASCHFASFISGDQKYLLFMLADITDLKVAEKEKDKFEAQVQQAQKLEAIGTLAGGIAHDFNNMLSVITGNISYALSSLNKDGELYNVLSEAQKGVKQAQTLTQQLLTFSKGGEPVKKIADINQLIKETTQFVISGANVRCEFDLSNSLSNVEVDTGQINQVISNLVINANQSMPDGGIIYIKTENIKIEGEKSIPLPDGQYIKITVEDQGIGISKNHIEKIFDPFFTTKQKGNGLGLSTVYSIIKKHNGHISAYSEIEKGTSFHIYIPASQKELKRNENNLEVSHQGQGKILIMDDQEPILTMVELMLNQMGYETSSAIDGSQAVEIYKDALSTEKPFDLVVLDLTVPGGMGGLKTIIELLKIDPNVNAIVSSGYSNNPIMANYEDYGFCGVVPKPYTMSHLSEVLNQIFGENH